MDTHILKLSFKKTLPVFFGYIFLGSAVGLLLSQTGYGLITAFFMALFVYAGSGQMLLISLMAINAPLSMIAFLTLVLNSRHAFYGLSFIERFKKTGKMYPYMIFSLTDETYSLLCSTSVSKTVNDGVLIKYIALLNQLYWIFGCVMGCALGKTLSFNFEGVDFAMTALFVVIFIEQWKSFKSHLPVYTGIASSLICLLIFGRDSFILPSLIITVSFLTLINTSAKTGKIFNEGRAQQ